MSISALTKSFVTTTESLLIGLGETVDVTHSAANTSRLYNAAGTYPGTKFAAFSQAMTAGAATINLTSMIGTNGVAVNGDGLHVQAIKIANPATNLHPLVVVPGASTAYLLFGAAFKLTLMPGDEILFTGLTSTPIISSSLKNIDITDGGNASTQSANFTIVMG